jgi:hypothetical protein
MPVSLDPSIARENGLALMCITRDSSKYGCSAIFTIHIVLVLAPAKPFEIFESGKYP